MKSRIKSARGIISPLPIMASNIEKADKPLMFSGLRKFVIWRGTNLGQRTHKINHYFRFSIEKHNMDYHLGNWHPHEEKCSSPSRYCSNKFDPFLWKFSSPCLQILAASSLKGCSLTASLFLLFIEIWRKKNVKTTRTCLESQNREWAIITVFGSLLEIEIETKFSIIKIKNTFARIVVLAYQTHPKRILIQRVVP